ncbi:putative iSBma2, transposase [Burkholderia mallei]|nr:putative iSBma2, transposase [Burkholderia mallei]
MRRNIGQPRTLLPLSRSWFKGTLLEAHWPYRRGQVTTHLRAAQADGGAQLRRCQAAAWAPLCPYAWATQGGRAVLAGRGGTEHQEDCDAAGAEAEKGASGSRLALRAHAAASGERFALQLRLPARGEPAILIPERQNPTLTKTWGSSAVCAREGEPFAFRRPARGRGGLDRGGARRREDGARERAAHRVPERGGDSL